MNLSELFKGISIKRNTDIKGITNNSNEVKPGYLFIAVKGNRLDGSQFIEDAIDRGAVAILSEKAYKERAGISFITVNSVNDILWQTAKKFYGDPSASLNMTGITGTNGKTTTSYVLRNIYQAAGIKTGLLGTIDYIIGDRRIPAALTTPDVLKVNQYLSQMTENECKACVMEVSSHAAEQGRVNGINFKSCIYTNLGRDHLDYHKTIDSYLDAKAKLFKALSEDSWAVVNVDDPYSGHIIENTKARVIGYGIGNVGTRDLDFKLKARGIKITSSGMKFDVYTSGFDIPSCLEETLLQTKGLDKGFLLKTKLIGYHNIYNILGAVGVALSSGASEDAIKEGVYITDNVPGRLEKVDLGQPFDVFVDFAHTPDALENVLNTMKYITNKKIIVVFGCGGDRDKEKRPLMGRIAGRQADYSIITSDNPRTEDPLQIVSEIERGFAGGKYKILVNRKEAIKEALESAEPGDVVLIAGKGHENYQILKNTAIPFSDKNVVEELLKEYAGSIC